MNIYIDTFRTWWQKPKNITDLDETREISFLELFYDLAYVVIIIQLTHFLVDHLSVAALLQYIGLYAMVWFAWINGSLYHEMHGNNDIRTRAFTFLQMFSLVWMGIFVHDAFSPDGYQGFALAYGVFLGTLTYLWWRTGVHDPEHRPLSRPYTIAFVGATAAFLYSTQVPFVLATQIWLGAIIFCLLLPIVLMQFRRGMSEVQLAAARRIRPSLVERFGLLTIIVLGENLISIVSGATYVKTMTSEVVGTVTLSILIVFSLWWVYFDFVSRRVPRQTDGSRLSWIYLHLFLTMSIGLTAVGLLNLIEHPMAWEMIDRWFVVGPIAVFLVVVCFLIKTLNVQPENWPIYRKGLLTAAFSALLLACVGLLELERGPTLVAAWFLLTLPVFAGFRVWLRRRAGQ